MKKEIATAICDKIATTSYSLRAICAIGKREDKSWPTKETVRKWLRDNPEFAAEYARVKMIQADIMIEEIDDIARDGTLDYYVDDNGEKKLDQQHVQRSRLIIDTRKWIACKLVPQVYGDKTYNESNITLRTHEELLDELT